MNQTLTFLHLSDIHFAEFEGEPNLDLEEQVRERMVQDIELLHGRVGDMAGVLVVGDVANKGQPREYEVATTFLDGTCELVNCPKDHVICVPGNHDIDRGRHDAVHDAVRYQLRSLPPEQLSDELLRLLREQRGAGVLLDPLSAYNQFALQYGCDIAEGRLTWAPKSFSLGSRELLIHGITSAWICDEHDSDRQDQLKVVVGAFQCGQISRDPECISVAMVHHPASWIRDIREVEPWMNGAHIVLTGHEHESGIIPDAAGRRVTIASGAVNPTRAMWGWVPAYNVIQLELAGDEGDELLLRVYVRRWQGDVATFGPDPRFADPFELSIRLGPERLAGEEIVEEVPEMAPAPPPEPIESEAHDLVFTIMRAAPDVRHRAARELELVGDTEATGLALDREILDEAVRRQVLAQLQERIRSD